jgi:CRP-like cAMP-binding protein
MNEVKRRRKPGKEKQRYLSRVAVFADLNQAELVEVASLMAIRSYGIGRTFFMPTDQVGSVFFLLVGRVHLYYLTECGKKLVVSVLNPGSLFGEKALFGNREQTMFAEATTNCVVGVMQREVFYHLMYKYPRVAFRLAEAQALRLAQLESSLVEMAFKPVSARLAHVLLSSAKENGAGEEVYGFTHGDLSDMLGTYRETVTSTLGEFKAHGLIAIDRKCITLLDRRGLEYVANRQSSKSS